MKKQPEITQRTRQRFVDAFWSLVREEPVSKIAVSELTRRAGYNRSTFYEYFLDTDDLLAYVETQLLEQIRQTVLETTTQSHSPGTLLRALFLSMNEELYLLLGPNGDSGFMGRVRAELLPLVEANFPLPPEVPQFDYLVCFAHSAMFGLLQHWNEKGKDLSAEEMSELMQGLVLRGLMSRMPPPAQDPAEAAQG